MIDRVFRHGADVTTFVARIFREPAARRAARFAAAVCVAVGVWLLSGCDERAAERRLASLVEESRTRESPDAEWEEAIRKIARGARDEAVRLRASYVFGNALRSAERYEEAAAAYARCDVEGFILRDMARYYRAECLRRLQRHDEAVDALRSLLQDFPAFPLPATATFALAEEYEASGESGKSLAAFQSIADDPDLGRSARVRAAKALSGIDKHAEAFDLLQTLIEEKGNDAHALRAVEELQRIVSANPALKLTRRQEFLQAQVLHDNGQRARARDLWDKVVRSGSDDLTHRSRYAVGMSYMRERDWGNANKVFTKLIATAGASYKARGTLQKALAARRDQKRTTALKMFDDLERLYPKSDVFVECLMEHAWTLKDAGDYAGALAFYSRVARDFGKSSFGDEASWQSAWCQIKLGSNDSAIQSLTSLVLQHPKSSHVGRAWFWIGKLSERVGKWSESADAYRRVVEADTYYYVDRAIERLGALESDGRIPRSVVPALRRVVAKSAISLDTLRGQVSDRVTLMEALSDYGAAIAELTSLAQRDASQRAKYTFHVVTAYQAAGKPYQAYLAAYRFTTLPEVRSNGTAPPIEIGELLYPLPYPEAIEKEGREFDIDPHYIAATIREESRFNPTVKSWAGAYGLMQVMPDTGKVVAQRLGIESFTTSMLLDPEVNIRIGSWYLRSLMDQFGDDPYLVAGAYNGGPGRMSRWQTEFGVTDRDEFIEQIPIDETRNHIFKVMHAYNTYTRLYEDLGAE